jgi:hypothetical protein
MYTLRIHSTKINFNHKLRPGSLHCIAFPTQALLSTENPNNDLAGILTEFCIIIVIIGGIYKR